VLRVAVWNLRWNRPKSELQQMWGHGSLETEPIGPTEHLPVCFKSPQVWGIKTNVRR
jgi:hypothetical protein